MKPDLYLSMMTKLGVELGPPEIMKCVISGVVVFSSMMGRTPESVVTALAETFEEVGVPEEVEQEIMAAELRYRESRDA